MNETTKLAFKQRLKQFAADLIAQRIASAQAAVDNAQQAANSEEKSSAGDKYETSRAMGHLEKDMHSRQLAGAMAEMNALQGIPVQTLCNKVAPGAVVITGQATFFLSAGLGKQPVDGQDIFFLSPKAPLAVLLLHKTAGAQFQFNGRSVTILDLY